MLKSERKEAARAWRERPPNWGVFLVRCAAAGQAWVGGSRSLDTHRNRLWFMLQQGAVTTPDLQAAWRTHGEAGFAFEALESLDPDLSDLARADLLKRRTEHWRRELNARAV